MIKYPLLKENAVIGVTAPSSGVPEALHPILKEAVDILSKEGFSLNVLDTPWTQSKAKSAPATVRAEELQQLITDEQTDIIIPPWGGELLIEILEHLDFNSFKKKWILGYSDTSLLLLAMTLTTGTATAHGTNLVDLRGRDTDATTAGWKKVLSTQYGGSVIQYSSEKYQKEWQHENPTPYIFHLTEDTKWKTIDDKDVKVTGRLLGGCIDTIHHLAGTPFGDVKHFSETFIDNEPILWYFENCDMSAKGLRRSIVQMKLSGWFENTSGIMFGRSESGKVTEDYTEYDVYQDIEDELNIPVIYDIDCGHVPPQVTLINGASATVETAAGRGKITQTFN